MMTLAHLHSWSCTQTQPSASRGFSSTLRNTSCGLVLFLAPEPQVFSGHQPHGESPTVVRHTRSGLLVVTADTSQLGAAMTSWAVAGGFQNRWRDGGF